MIQLWRDAPPQIGSGAVCHLDGEKQPGATTRPTTARARSSSARCGARPATASYIRPGVWRLKCVRCPSSNFEFHRRRSRGGVVRAEHGLNAWTHSCRLRSVRVFSSVQLASVPSISCSTIMGKKRRRQTRAIRAAGAADDAPGPCPPRLSGDTRLRATRMPHKRYGGRRIRVCFLGHSPLQ